MELEWYREDSKKLTLLYKHAWQENWDQTVYRDWLATMRSWSVGRRQYKTNVPHKISDWLINPTYPKIMYIYSRGGRSKL